MKKIKILIFVMVGIMISMVLLGVIAKKTDLFEDNSDNENEVDDGVLYYQDFTQWGANNTNITTETDTILNLPLGYVAEAGYNNARPSMVTSKGVTVGGERGFSMTNEMYSGVHRYVSVKFNTDYKFHSIAFTFSGVDENGDIIVPQSRNSEDDFNNMIKFTYGGGPANGKAFAIAAPNNTGATFYCNKDQNGEYAYNWCDEVMFDNQLVDPSVVINTFFEYAKNGEDFTIHIEIDEDDKLVMLYLECREQMFAFNPEIDYEAKGCFSVWNRGWSLNNSFNVKSIAISTDLREYRIMDKEKQDPMTDSNIPDMSNRVIECLELPSEKIIEGACYKVPTLDVYLTTGTSFVTLSEYFSSKGETKTIYYHLVETLPQNMLSSENDVLHVYIVNDSGYGFVQRDDVVCSIVDLLEVRYTDIGWTEDIYEETVEGYDLYSSVVGYKNYTFGNGAYKEVLIS